MKPIRVVMQNLVRVAVMAVMTMGVASMASAQVANSGPQNIALNASLTESLTLSLTANAVNFTLTPGAAANAGSTTITATTAWVLKPGRTSVGVYAYFASAAAALTDGATPADNIPSSAFLISDNGGTSTALTGSPVFGGAGAGLAFPATAITAANRAGNRTDLMAFNINLTTLPQLPAAVYTGTLSIQAQATP